MASPTVPGNEVQRVSFAGSAVPITAVTVYKGRARISRLLSFSPVTKIGTHQVELTDLQGNSLIEPGSLAVTGAGHCTILDFSFSHEQILIQAGVEERRHAKRDIKSKLKDLRAATDKDLEPLKKEHEDLASRFLRTKTLRQLADRVADQATSAFPPSGGAGGGAAAEVQRSMDIDGVTKALDWWEKKAAAVDEECCRLAAEGKRVEDAMAKIESDHSTAVAALQEASSQNKVVITVDVEELRCPIELEISYMTRGATWSPSYDLRVGTQTDSMSCTYYGRVAQRTAEEWEGVSLKLSTAEPSTRSTPPPLETKTVLLKPPPPPPPAAPAAGGFLFGSSAALSPAGSAPAAGGGFGSFGSATPVKACGATTSRYRGAASPPLPGAPPPPPEAKVAVAQVEGGDGGLGAVSFAVGVPANIKSDGQAKKLSVGVLELSTEVFHYIVPSKEPAAYLQTKATNNSAYLLLPSDDVSVFFDNNFVTKTSLASVSPGQSFQAFLGTDPAVKITFAPTRKTAKQKGLLGKVDHVTYIHSTSISNTKKVAVTCVIVDAIPRSTDEIIKVTLQQPAQAKVSEAADAIDDEMLVDAALDLFAGVDDDAGGAGNASKASTTALKTVKTVKTGVSGVVKGPTNHLVWVVKIAPQEDISIPLEYTVEWPVGKEIAFHSQGAGGNSASYSKLLRNRR